MVDELDVRLPRSRAAGAAEGPGLPGLAGLARAREIFDARGGRRLLDASTRMHDLTVDDAYVVQSRLTELRLAAGRTIVGYKLGYTSSAMRRQMGVPAPNHGPLFDDMVLEDGGLADRYVQPRVEPEIGLVLGRAVDPRAPLLGALADAVAEVRLCLEVVDSVWQDYRFTAAQNTADGSSAAGVVLGPVLAISALECHKVTVGLFQDGALVASATGAAAGGHPLHALGWLSRDLAARGIALARGDIVITGGLTPAYPLPPGSVVTATTLDGCAVASCRSPQRSVPVGAP